MELLVFDVQGGLGSTQACSPPDWTIQARVFRRPEWTTLLSVAAGTAHAPFSAPGHYPYCCFSVFSPACRGPTTLGFG